MYKTFYYIAGSENRKKNELIFCLLCPFYTRVEQNEEEINSSLNTKSI